MFGTGLFSDVRVNQVGATLVVEVSEYQIVNQVLFQGNKKIKDAQLTEAVQVKSRSSFQQSILETDRAAIETAYDKIGRSDAVVTVRTMDLGDNRVNVVFDIDEGDRTKISTINFVGNTAFSSRRLADVIVTKRSSWLSFLLRNDVFDKEKLRADEELLRRFYFDHGYADFRIISASGELDEDINQYAVTIVVDEGQLYEFGDVTIESSIPGLDGDTLQSAVETRSGAVYAAKKVENSLIALTEQAANRGYAFAQVTPRGDRDFETHKISVAYVIDQGPKAYIERIEIRGNDRTRDHIIRREFEVSEGDAFNQVLIQRAKKRLEELNYFEKVEISTAPGAEADQIVVVVDVVEKATGEFSIGAGYTTSGVLAGPSLTGAITERNFLGRGQFIRFSAGAGFSSSEITSSDFMLSFTEPYFLGRRIAAGFDIFRTTQTYTNYESTSTGGTVRLGLPISESLSTQLAYTLAQDEYGYTTLCDGTDDPASPDADCDVSQAVMEGVAEGPWLKSSVSASLVYNTIDDMKKPHSGFYASFNTEFAGLGGDAHFAKFTARGSYYHTLSEELDLVGLLSLGGGHIVSYGDDGLRLFDHFQGNNRMIRGFEAGGIGPVASGTSGDHLGGTTYLNASAEALFPVPGIPESYGLQAAIFADAATLYGTEVSSSLVDQSTVGMQWRASVGVGLTWDSPFGPLRIDYAIPVISEESDDIQEFSFGISSRF